MKKFFTLVMALVAVMAVNAKVVTFDFTNPTALGITPSADASKGVELPAEGITVDGVLMTSAKVQKNPNVLFTKSDGTSYELRTYNQNTITFNAGAENITAVEFAGSDVKYAEVTGKSWTGEAASVTFTGTATSKITSITLTIGEPAVVWVPDTISVSQANALIAAGDTHDHYVIGVAMGAPFVTYATFDGKVTFWMADATNPTDTIQFYNGAATEGAKWASLEEAQETIHEGDTVLVYAGALELYTAKNITEITGGNFVEVLGFNPNPPTIEIERVSVTRAIEIAQALNPDKGYSKSTAKKYEVVGYVVSVSSSKTNTFYMADEAGVYGEFQAYEFTESDYAVAEGDYVVVTGNITHYYGESEKDGVKTEYHTYEVKNGTVYHEEAPEGIENVVLTEKAQKVMVDGVMYIVRDNKMFDVRGAQVR